MHQVYNLLLSLHAVKAVCVPFIIWVILVPFGDLSGQMSVFEFSALTYV